MKVISAYELCFKADLYLFEMFTLSTRSRSDVAFEYFSFISVTHLLIHVIREVHQIQEENSQQSDPYRGCVAQQSSERWFHSHTGHGKHCAMKNGHSMACAAQGWFISAVNIMWEQPTAWTGHFYVVCLLLPLTISLCCHSNTGKMAPLDSFTVCKMWLFHALKVWFNWRSYSLDPLKNDFINEILIIY